MADCITLSLTPYDQILTKDYSTISYVYSFYTPEELAKYHEDMQYCIDQGWIEEAGHNDYNRSEGYIPGRSSVWLDTNTNTFYKYCFGKNLQKFLDYFVYERQNFRPIQQYFEEHPDKGSTSILIQ